MILESMEQTIRQREGLAAYDNGPASHIDEMLNGRVRRVVVSILVFIAVILCKIFGFELK